MHTRDPRTGKRNIGMYRMQVYDGQTTGMHWQRQKVAAEHYREALRNAASARRSDSKTARVAAMAESAGGAVTIPDGPIGGLPQVAMGKLKGSRLEVAVAIGTDPATTFSAIVPAPPEVEEFMIAGFLRGKPVEIVKCETVDLEVPANAEIILEGYVELGELRSEGPFGDHTGFYTMTDEYPVFHLTCITHRKDPIYAATIVGKPPMEDAWMGKAVERIFLPAMKMTIPELVDIHLPVEAVFHNLMLVSIRKSYPGHARKVMNASGRWGRPCLPSASSSWMKTAMCRTLAKSCCGWRITSILSEISSSCWGRSIRSITPLAAELRLEDGHRRHAQMEGRGLRASLARHDRDGPRDEGQGRRYVGGAWPLTDATSMRPGQVDCDQRI